VVLNDCPGITVHPLSNKAPNNAEILNVLFFIKSISCGSTEIDVGHDANN